MFKDGVATDLRSEIKKLVYLALPLVGMYTFGFAMRMTTITFVGQYLSEDDFDGLALGNTMTNITGYSVIIALVSPMDSLCTQAFGARNWKLYSVTVRRAVICAVLYLIPIIILWSYIYDILTYCGYNETIAKNAYQYAMIYIAALPTCIALEMSNRILSSQVIFQFVSFISMLDVVNHQNKNRV